MIKRIFFISVISLTLIGSSYGQYLHIGAKSFFMAKIYMGFFKYDLADYVYYFSNEYNETIRFGGLEDSESKSYKPYPDIYIRYNSKNHLFFQADVFAMNFTNEAKYKNSVDYSVYTQVFNPLNEKENLGYNSIKLNWSFYGTSVSAGFIFAKSKSLRPFIFGGGSALFLMQLNQGDFYDDSRQIRNDIIFSNLSTFKKTTFYITGGVGFQYKAFSVDFYYRNTIADADIYADSYINAEDISLVNRPNYDYFDSFNVSVSLNLLSFNLSKNKMKNQ
jgi:hypothetical protein